MKLRHALSVAVLAVTGIAVPAVGPVSTAHADTLICDQFGSAMTGGKYIVMNNRWGSNAEQCINVTSSGFQIRSQQGSTATNGAPLSYPAIYVGCHYGACSPGTNLPRQLGQIGGASSSISYNYVGGTFDASYDIWMDPTAKTTGVNQMELMIWFNRQGSIQPIGGPVGTTTIAGRSWEVWQGNNGGNDVVSYVAPSPVGSLSFNVMDFVHDVDARTRVDSSWYLTSIQAGFEPWNGGAGLAVNSFSADVTAGTDSGPGPGSGPASCAVTYHVDNAWSGGFTASVTLKNTGTAPLNDWALGWTMPSGAQVTNGWNATFTQTGQQVTAKAPAWAPTLAAGASTSIGFQAAGGSTTAATAFAVGQTNCTS